MKFAQLIGFLVVVLLQYSCIPTENDIEKLKNEKLKDTCKTLVSAFNYPDDLERLDSIMYICNSSLLGSTTDKNGLKLTTSFDDRNYSLFNYDFRTKLLWDKKNDFLLCFKRSVDYQVFNKESIERIYIVDKNLMPLYSIGSSPGTGITLIQEFFYDNRYEELYSYVIQLKNDVQPELKTIDYVNIVRLVKSLNAGNYIQTEKCYSYESPHFKTTPYWTEN